MAGHRAHYTAVIGVLQPVFEALEAEVVTLTSALPDGSAARRMEGTTEVHYLAETSPEKMDERFWRATAETFDRLHAERPFDIVFGRGVATLGFFRYSRFAGRVPVILHEGTYPRWLHQVESRSGVLSNALSLVLAPLFSIVNHRQRLCLTRASRVVCITPALESALRRAYWWRKPRTVALTYGFDTSRYHPQLPPPDRPPRLVSLGRMTWDKGILPMIDVLAGLKNRDVVLEAIGPASPKKHRAVIAHAERRGVSKRYSAPGPVLHSDVPDRLVGALAFLFPSTHAEGLGKVVLEAMAAGLPVVAYKLPVLEGLIEHGVTGFQVPIRSVRAMTECVDQLLGDPSLAARMGVAARQKLEAEFQPKLINAKWKALLREVIDESATQQGTETGTGKDLTAQR